MCVYMCVRVFCVNDKTCFKNVGSKRQEIALSTCTGLVAPGRRIGHCSPGLPTPTSNSVVTIAFRKKTTKME